MSATCIKLLEQVGLDSEGHPITAQQVANISSEGASEEYPFVGNYPFAS